MLKWLRNLEELYLIGFYGRQFEIERSVGPLLRAFEKLRIVVVDILDDPVRSLLLYTKFTRTRQLVSTTPTVSMLCF